MVAHFSKCQNFSTSPHAFSTLDAHREGEADSESSEADAEVAAEISPSSAILAGSLQSRALSDKLPPTCAPYRSALPVHRMSSSFSRTAGKWPYPKQAGNGGWILGCSYKPRASAKRCEEARSNDPRYIATGRRGKWTRSEDITQEDKNVFKEWIDGGFTHGGGRATPSPPPMNSRVERSSQRIESRLSATPSPEPSAHAAASEGAFSPLGAAAAGQINAAAPMQPPPPVDPHIVALVRDLKAAVVKLALKEACLNELERRPALHVVPPKRTRAASLAAQPTEQPPVALIQPCSAATRHVRAKFGRRRDLAAFLRQRA